MSYENAELLRDKNGNPIPQYFNISTGKFEPVTGENGGTSTQLIGSIMEEAIFKSEIIPPNSALMEIIEIKGSEFEMGARFSGQLNGLVSIRYQCRSDGNSIVNPITVAERNTGIFMNTLEHATDSLKKLVGDSFAVFAENASPEDVLIRTLSITQIK